MNAQVCESCKGTGIIHPGEEWQQFCPDCLTGNTMFFQAAGSKLDPAKYPACQFEPNSEHQWGGGSCDDQGNLKDGSPCDCDKASILGFESLGYSHELAVKVMAVVTSCDQGCAEPLSTLVDKIDSTRDKYGLIGTEAAAMESLFRENPEAVQMALDHSWLRRFL